MASENTTEQPVQRKAYLSVDIEGSGASFDNPTIAIGACVGYQDKNEVIVKRTFCLKHHKKRLKRDATMNSGWVSIYWIY
jgi:hypothetical protein